MRRVVVLLELLIAVSIAILALVAWWDPFVALLKMVGSRDEMTRVVRAAIARTVGLGSGPLGIVSAGVSEAGILAIPPSVLLWRCHARMATANIGGIAARRLARIHKWMAIVAAIVILIALLTAVVLLNSMAQEHGTFWLFALLFIPSVVLSPGVFVALAVGQVGSAIAGLAFLFGDNLATT